MRPMRWEKAALNLLNSNELRCCPSETFQPNRHNSLMPKMLWRSTQERTQNYDSTHLFEGILR